ncbi:unnamed protein product [Echinostoma caproni]|uniref:Homocysteine-responsive endoplasmic reticulum-resident ubiquitin-like domain member 2 protein n=1 Tax=Echinostoma caproni TaxID=27848 RepID=A0A183A7G0_9TREM|nr:unnamed protein product [Echinostoma caproni]
MTGITNEIPPAELERFQREYYEYLQNFFLTNGGPSATSPSTPVNNSSTPLPASQTFWYTQPTWGYMGVGQQPWNYWYHPNAYGFPAPSAPSSSVEPDPGAVNPAGPNADWMQGARAIFAGLGVGGQDQQAAEVPVNPAPPEEAPQPQAQQQQQQQQQQQAMMVGNPMMGGFMGAEEFGEGAENLDIVDRFYMLFRLCLFIGLCFAYSSLDKAIIVFSVAAYVYFYNIYRRHAAIRRAAAEAQRNQAEAAQRSTNSPSSESSQTEIPNFLLGRTDSEPDALRHVPPTDLTTVVAIVVRSIDTASLRALWRCAFVIYGFLTSHHTLGALQPSAHGRQNTLGFLGQRGITYPSNAKSSSPSTG